MENSGDRTESGWSHLHRSDIEGHPVEGEVIDFIHRDRGPIGLTVVVEGVRGFVPAQFIVELRRPAPADSLEARLEAMIGRQLQLKVVEIHRNRNRLVLAELAAG